MVAEHDNDLDEPRPEDLEYDVEFSLATEFLNADEGEEAVAEARTLPDDGEARQTLLARRLIEWNSVEEYEAEADARALAAKLKGMAWAEVEAFAREAVAAWEASIERDYEEIEKFAARDPDEFQYIMAPMAERLIAKATDRYVRDREASGLGPAEPHPRFSRARLDRPFGTWVVSLVDGRLNHLATYHADDAEWTLTEVTERRERATAGATEVLV